MKNKLRLGTRDSKLAVKQTEIIVSQIKNKYPDIKLEIIKIKTKGDKILDKPLHKIGGKGLFIKELETSLLDNKIDMAVHSMKDVPYNLPDGLKIDILSKREDPRDIFITLDRKSISQMNELSVIGTGSLRRKIQLKKINNNFIIRGLRGNILTRIKKLENNEFDGIVLAVAGIKRLNLDIPYTYFSVDEMIPSQGQGIIGIETRKDFNVDFLINSVHSKDSEITNRIERDFMKEINGTCSMPVGIYAKIVKNKIIVRCMVADENLDNMKVLKEEIYIDEYLDYGKKLSDKL